MKLRRFLAQVLLAILAAGAIAPLLFLLFYVSLRSPL